MYYQKDGNVITVRLSVGDEIIASITELCRKENIEFAHVEGLGASRKATVGFYSVNDGKYFSKTFDTPMEIVSLIGNITRKDGEPYLHFHASFSGEDCNVVGGHLNEAVIGVTAEIFITVIDGKMERKVHPVTGINVLDI